MKRARASFAVVVLALLAGCSGELETPGEALRIFGTTLPQAFVGEPYRAQVRAVGGLRPFTYSIDQGEPPPGISFQAGTLVGTPAETGSFSFTVVVSDANLSKTFQEYVLQVVEAPPAELLFNPPLTDVQRVVTLRATVENARDLQALRTQIRWDAERFELVEGSVLSARSSFALLSQAEPGSLRVDFAVLGGSLEGNARAFTFELRPLEPGPLELRQETEFLSSLGRHAFDSRTEGRAPEPELPATPEGGEGLPGEGEVPATPDPPGETPDGGEGSE